MDNLDRNNSQDSSDEFREDNFIKSIENKKGHHSKLTGPNNENSVPMERYLALVKENADLRNREAKHIDTVK